MYLEYKQQKEEPKKEWCGQCIIHAHMNPEFQQDHPKWLKMDEIWSTQSQMIVLSTLNRDTVLF